MLRDILSTMFVASVCVTLWVNIFPSITTSSLLALVSVGMYVDIFVYISVGYYILR